MATSIAAITGDLLRSPNLQVENPMAANLQYQQAQAEKQRVAESQQEGQLNALKIQEAQQQMASQQAIQKAYAESQGDLDQTIPKAAQYGALPSDLVALQQKSTAQKKDVAALDKDNLELHATHTTNALNALGPLLAMPEDQAAQQYPVVMGAIIKDHDLGPNDLAKVGLDPNVYPGHDTFQHVVNGLNGYQKTITNEQTNRKNDADVASLNATAADKTLDAATKQRAQDAAALAVAAKQGPDAYQAALGQLPYARAKLFEGLTDPAQITRLGMTPEQQVKADQTAAQQAQTAAHNQAMEQQGAGRLGVERNRLSLETGMMGGGAPAGNTPPGSPQAKLSGDQYLATLPPGMANQVKAIAEGRATLPAMSRNLLSGQVRNAVFQYDPDYSDQRAQVRKAFTTGADGKNIGALNTATMHLDQLSNAADALKNGSFQPGNQAYNYFSTVLGQAPPTNFGSLKAAVAGEMATALKGNATDQEIHTMSQNISSAQSPDQLKGAVDTNLHILGAKLNTYQERYNSVNPGDKVWSPVLPSAKAVYAKHGIDPTAPSGAQSSSSGSAFKAGDKRTVNGKTYVRDGNGVWTAQ